MKSLLKGEYGETPAPVDKDLQQQAIGDSAVITCRQADLLNDDYQSAKGDFEKAMTENNLLSEPSDENVLIYIMFPEIGMNFLAIFDNPDYFEPEPLDIHELTDSSYLVSVDDREYSVTLKADNSVIINDGSQVNKVNSSPVVEAGLGVGVEAGVESGVEAEVEAGVEAGACGVEARFEAARSWG